MESNSLYPEIMTRKQCANYLKISLSNLDKSDCPRIKLSTHAVRYRKSSVDEWLGNLEITSEQTFFEVIKQYEHGNLSLEKTLAFLFVRYEKLREVENSFFPTRRIELPEGMSGEELEKWLETCPEWNKGFPPLTAEQDKIVTEFGELQPTLWSLIGEFIKKNRKKNCKKRERKLLTKCV